MLSKLKKAREVEEAKETNNFHQTTAEKRMEIDLQRVNAQKSNDFELQFPKEGNITELIIVAYPKETSYYRSTKLRFSYTATGEYPYVQPEVRCLPKILHPNIDTQGNVCLSLLKEGWSPNYDLYYVIIGLLNLLNNLRPEDVEKPLDADAAELFNKSSAEFEKVVQETIRGKSYFNRKFDNVYWEGKK